MCGIGRMRVGREIIVPRIVNAGRLERNTQIVRYLAIAALALVPLAVNTVNGRHGLTSRDINCNYRTRHHLLSVRPLRLVPGWLARQSSYSSMCP
jgi:hypothetical protein